MKLKKFFSFLVAAIFTISSLFQGNIIITNAESPNSANTNINNDISIKGINSFGNLIADEFSQIYEEQLNGNGCNVQWLKRTEMLK